MPRRHGQPEGLQVCSRARHQQRSAVEEAANGRAEAQPFVTAAKGHRITCPPTVVQDSLLSRQSHGERRGAAEEGYLLSYSVGMCMLAGTNVAQYAALVVGSGEPMGPYSCKEPASRDELYIYIIAMIACLLGNDAVGIHRTKTRTLRLFIALMTDLSAAEWGETEGGGDLFYFNNSNPTTYPPVCMHAWLRWLADLLSPFSYFGHLHLFFFCNSADTVKLKR